ncbi:Uncharacterized conserved protein [Plasmopara halstedii]|uniref:Uncharacterized conserved protein n=1 Tax=Plasmopara halstedii TaxID=4781 RepID=A0A0P1A934_PLAHL|nr:Uncharacterized conserved protein [Plasmopara halstedii]CEG37210.1 Uncharacterized conserved protein [Plasmopara halstedii]|eukprot:XP_024573579.1 Uncharacterized conserved protein [Plasmopara halstedii]
MIREVWRIELGVGVGPFRLGASIAEVLHALKSRLPIRPFEVAYDSSEPYKRDVVVRSHEDGLNLHFDPVQQTLKFIEFYEVNRVALKFGRVVIFGGDIFATFMSVYNLFGPTFPGHYDIVEKNYVLGYDGGCVKFSIPEEYQKLYQDCTDLPMEFPNGATPAATGLDVFVGDDYRSPDLPSPIKKHYFEEVNVEIGDKQTLVTFSGRKQCLRLGCSPQEVVSELGSPLSVFRKSEDPNDGAVVAGGLNGEYFHNYPHLGLDILYNSMHRASKVILKTNALGHPDFGAYNKCNFRIKFPSLNAPHKSGADPQINLEITPQTPWKDICLVFNGASDTRPIIHDNGLGVHPFGPSLCYSPTPGCIFEVMKNGFIATVTLTSFRH